MAPVLQFEGHAFIRHRVLLATLSGRALRVINIRSNEDDVGLKDHEVKFLQLAQQVTNGSTLEINHTGTSFLYKPGIISGGSLTFDCGTERAIGYFLEPLLVLAPFSKQSCEWIFTGITNDNQDLSMDCIRTVLLPIFKQFGVDDVDLKITKRGAPPLGGGEVQFRCGNIRAVQPIQWTDQGRIKRIRGIAYATRVSPQTANRLIESSRSFLNRFIPDVYIYSDVYRGVESGRSPGFGLSLVAESTTGVLLAAEHMARGGETPEDIGVNAAKLLYRNVSVGGCVDPSAQWLVLLLMALCGEDVSKVEVGKLSEFTILFLRDVRDFLGTTFKIKTRQQNDGSSTVALSCVGIGYVNIGKKVV